MKRTLFFCAPAVFFFITLGAVAQTVTFSEQPENVTVGVGGDVTLKCQPVVNNAPGIVLWEVHSQNGSILATVLNGTDILGATAYVGGGPSMSCLILMGLTSRADQAEVICTGIDMGGTLTPVAATPRTFITVHCVPTLTSPPERISVGSDVTNVASRFNSSVGGCNGVVLIICTHSTGNVTLSSVNGAVTHLNPMGGWKQSDFLAETGPAQSISVSCIASQDNFESVTVSVELQIDLGLTPAAAVSCGTVCVIVIVVVLVVVVPCCVAGLVLGIILCYCCLCKERPDGMRTKSERLSEKEEKDVELT